MTLKAAAVDAKAVVEGRVEAAQWYAKEAKSISELVCGKLDGTCALLTLSALCAECGAGAQSSIAVLRASRVRSTLVRQL
jgi:hypothetical protein